VDRREQDLDAVTAAVAEKLWPVVEAPATEASAPEPEGKTS
jgi:hypothetical protein